MIVVSDTSPISNLLKIDEIDLLQKIFARVVVPDAVFREICKVDENRVALASLDWIEQDSVSNFELLDKLRETVDIGEAEAITLALERGADYLLIDESLGRSLARELGITITGLLGVLFRAKSDGHIKLVEPYVRRLVDDANFRLSSGLIEDALYQAGEK